MKARRLRRNTFDLLLLIFILGVAVVALLWAEFFPPEISGSVSSVAQKPSLQHILGTDALGRDMLARLFEGIRTTMAVGIGATLLAIVFGSIYGGLSGLAGPRVDEGMMRGVDVGLSLPYLFLPILIMSLFGNSLALLFITLGLVAWLQLSRVTRTSVRNLRNEPFLEAARMMGGSYGYVLRTHLFPQLGTPLVVYAAMMLPVVMMQEAFLSFIGLGVEPPMASWGTLVAEGVERIESAPWILLAAGGSFALWLICLHLAANRMFNRLNVAKMTGATDETISVGAASDVLNQA